MTDNFSDDPNGARRGGFIARLLQRPPRARAMSMAFVAAAVAATGIIDHYTGPKLVMTLFYIVPVVFGSAWLGGRWGYAIAFSCSLTHAIADWIGRDEHYTLITIPNRLFVLVIYLGVARCIAELMVLQRHLEARVQARTRELENALAAQTELQKKIGAAGRYERNAIGRELHDGLCQHLAATNIAAGMLASKLDAAQPEAAAEARAISGMLTGAIGQTRQIARGLLLAAVKPGELDAELRELCRAATRKYHTDCTYTHDGPMPQLNDAQASHLFFIAQEALRNAIKHSRATRIDVQLREESGAFELSIADNGFGLGRAGDAGEPGDAADASGKRPGLGMEIMRHRAELIGVQFEVISPASGDAMRKGTRVHCRLRGAFAPANAVVA